MRHCLLFIVLLTHGISGYGQRPDFETLRKDIREAKTNEAKARALTRYGDALPSNQYEQISAIVDSIQQLSLGAEDPAIFEASSNFLKGIRFFKSRKLVEAKPYLKNSAEAFHILSDDIEFRALNVLGLCYMRLQEIDSCIYLYNQMLQTIPPDNLGGIISAHGNLGSAYRRSGNYSQAIHHLEKVYELDSANAFTRINTSMNIAHIYSEMEMYNQAIETLHRVDLDAIPPIPPKAAYYNNLANNHQKNSDVDSALYYFQAALHLSRQINYTQGQFSALGNLVECYLNLEQYDSIPDLFRQMELQGDFNKDESNFRLSFLKGMYYLKIDQYAAAIDNLLSAETYTRVPQLRGLKTPIYLELIDAYNATDSLAKAKEYLTKLEMERKAPGNSSRDRFLAEAKANYLLAVKENELKESQTALEVFTTQRLILIALIFAVVIVSLILYKYYQKSHEDLSKQQAENQNLTQEVAKQKTKIIELKSKGLLEIQEIIYIKSDGHYLEFNLRSKQPPEVDRNKLKNILEVLPDYFVQIHRSYIINLKEVRVKYADKIEMKNGLELPVSRNYKRKLNEALSEFNLD